MSDLLVAKNLRNVFIFGTDEMGKKRDIYLH